MQKLIRAVVLMVLVAALFAGLPRDVRAEAYNGYTLYSPNNSTHTYLMDLDNNVAYSWTHTRSGGYSAYLLTNGNVIRPVLYGYSPLNGGAAAGMVQETNPDNQNVWEFAYVSSTYRNHHDIEPMPNGNVLLIAWELKTGAQAVQAGLDHYAEIWPDHIIEVEPTGPSSGAIVWEWHAWDHLIQDHDPSKDNYGVVAEHPELLDINTFEGGGMGSGDWMHINAISYNPEWDQIVMSSHFLDEIYVIDHSTTTAEAASHSGGNSGKGGDFLYRWGNPGNYDTSGLHYLHVAHCSVWVPQGCPGAGNLMVFNNNVSSNRSAVAELVPPADSEGNYILQPGSAYGPETPTWTFTASWFYSNHLGGCQRLPNGNTLIAESTSGYLFEVDAGGDLQWDYARSGEIARALRYGTSYPGLIPLGLGTSVEEHGVPTRLALSQVDPNPLGASTTINYQLPSDGYVTLKVYDVGGREVASLVDGLQTAGHNSVVFQAGNLSSGFYFCRLRAGGLEDTRKLVLGR